MKKFLAILLSSLALASNVQAEPTPAYLTALYELEDRAALKQLVDQFSNLADVKDVDSQMALFTEDAVVRSYNGDKLSSELKGKEQIGNAFSRYLALFDTVYHHNGQFVADIQGNTATATHYSAVQLVANKEGKKTMTSHSVRYQDSYQKIDGKWLIKERVSNFMITETREIQ